METMQDVIDRLRAKRAEHISAADRIDKAIQLLGSNGVTRTSHGTTNASATKTMSPSARRKISIAMKARHAARRNGATRSAAPKKKLHWTQTPEGRKKFAAIRAKSHRKAA